MRLAAAVLSLVLVATGASARAFSDAEKADLDHVSAYLNSIRTMKGGFVQIDPDGTVDQGTFVLSKPGRVRFEYDPPAPTLIVSDGHRVVVANKSLKTTDSYALSHTPLGLILDDGIDLKENGDVVAVAHQGDVLIVKARSSNFGVHADITLSFAEPTLELRQWTVIDNQGLSTTVALRETQAGVDVAPSAFVLPDKKSLSAAPAPQK
jgi:outer membrane lipoprotein-sorting protein